ncbi:MAG: SdrD B-like domain-containing protein, partial [Gemmataceae bacterium]
KPGGTLDVASEQVATFALVGAAGAGYPRLNLENDLIVSQGIDFVSIYSEIYGSAMLAIEGKGTLTRTSIGLAAGGSATELLAWGGELTLLTSVAVRSGAKIRNSGGTIDVKAHVLLHAGGQLQTDSGTTTFWSGAEFSPPGGNLQLQGGRIVHNSGILRVQNGVTVRTHNVQFLKVGGTFADEMGGYLRQLKYDASGNLLPRPDAFRGGSTRALLHDGAFDNDPHELTSLVGATLHGEGVIEYDTFTNLGTVSPGGGSEPIATLDFTGDYVHAGVLVAEFGGSGSDRLTVGGDVALAGTLQVIVLPDFYTSTPLTTYTLISNDGYNPVIGEFDGLFEGAYVYLAGLIYSISYVGGDGNDVTVERTGRVSGRVWQDEDNDGTKDPTEYGLGGRTVLLVNEVTGNVYPLGTDYSGVYDVASIPAGTYHVDFSAALGGYWTVTVPGPDNDADSAGITPSFTLAPFGESLGWDAGLVYTYTGSGGSGGYARAGGPGPLELAWDDAADDAPALEAATMNLLDDLGGWLPHAPDATPVTLAPAGLPPALPAPVPVLPDAAEASPSAAAPAADRDLFWLAADPFDDIDLALVALHPG